MLRLLLNTLHLLCKGTKPLVQIKAVFELRALSISGYMQYFGLRQLRDL